MDVHSQPGIYLRPFDTLERYIQKGNCGRTVYTHLGIFRTPRELMILGGVSTACDPVHWKSWLSHSGRGLHTI